MYNLLKKVPTTFFINEQVMNPLNAFFTLASHLPGDKISHYDPDVTPKFRYGRWDSAGNEVLIEHSQSPTFNVDIFSHVVLNIITSMLYTTTGKRGYESTYKDMRRVGRRGNLGFFSTYFFTTGLRPAEDTIRSLDRDRFCIISTYNGSVKMETELRRFYMSAFASNSEYYTTKPLKPEEIKPCKNKLVISNTDTYEPDIFVKINEELTKKIPALKRLLFGPDGVVIWTHSYTTSRGNTYPMPLKPEELMLILCTIAKVLTNIYPSLTALAHRMIYSYRDEENNTTAYEIFGSEEHIRTFGFEREMQFFSDLATACMTIVSSVPTQPMKDEEKLILIKKCFADLMQDNPVYMLSSENPLYTQYAHNVVGNLNCIYDVGTCQSMFDNQFKRIVAGLEHKALDLISNINNLKAEISEAITKYREICIQKARGTMSDEEKEKIAEIQRIVDTYPAIVNFFTALKPAEARIGTRTEDMLCYYITLFNQFTVSDMNEFKRDFHGYIHEALNNDFSVREEFYPFVRDMRSQSDLEERLKRDFIALMCDPEYKYMPYVGSMIRIDATQNRIMHPQRCNEYSMCGEGFIPNPHLMRYNCYGSYEGFIIDAIVNQDWAQVLELLVQAASELSATDSPVVKRFCEYILSICPQTKFIKVKDTDEWITFLELDSRLQKEEDDRKKAEEEARRAAEEAARRAAAAVAAAAAEAARKAQQEAMKAQLEAEKKTVAKKSRKKTAPAETEAAVETPAEQTTVNAGERPNTPPTPVTARNLENDEDEIIDRTTP